MRPASTPARCAWARGSSRHAPAPPRSSGELGSSGTDTNQAGSAARFFGAAGVALAATADVGSIVELFAGSRFGVTLLRDAYEFDAATFHRADRITTSASLGVGLHWP